MFAAQNGCILSKCVSCLAYCVTVQQFIVLYGFWHEHVRPDRDDYVEVVYENVRPGLNRYFEKLPMKEIDSLDVPYDFGSIMHIKLKDYSKNGKPTLTLKVNYSDEIGQRNQLSYYDVLQVNQIM